MKKYLDNRNFYTDGKKNILVLFDNVLPVHKNIYPTITGRLRSACHKTLTFYDIVFVFFFAGCLEIVFRLLWAPSPVSFLFPVLIYAMYHRIIQKPVDIRKRWYLLLPFFVFTFFLCSLLAFIHPPEVERLWIWFFYGAYMVFALICMFPIIIGIQNCPYFEYDTRKFFFIHYLSFAQLIGALLLFLILCADQQLLVIADDATAHSHSRWLAALILLVTVLASLLYLVLTKRPDETDFPLTLRMLNCKMIILDLFNEQKIFLNPDLTINVLSEKYKIDKSDLEFFFNEYIGKSFPFFVAEYRIAHAIKMITEQGDRYTLEAIGYECGFRCRTTFNKYFKLMTGVLPSQFTHIKNIG